MWSNNMAIRFTLKQYGREGGRRREREGGR
jgi:hypothetical protein